MQIILSTKPWLNIVPNAILDNGSVWWRTRLNGHASNIPGSRNIRPRRNYRLSAGLVPEAEETMHYGFAPVLAVCLASGALAVEKFRTQRARKTIQHAGYTDVQIGDAPSEWSGHNESQSGTKSGHARAVNAQRRSIHDAVLNSNRMASVPALFEPNAPVLSGPRIGQDRQISCSRSAVGPPPQCV